MGKSKKLQLTDGWAIYLRTSTEEAQAPERSQESQRRVIHDNLVRNSGLPVITEYTDTYTGRSTDRKDYQRMLADARLGKFSHVGIYAVDCFGRNDVECGRAFDELAGLGITVKIATYVGLDASNPSGRMIIGLMSSVARFESDRGGERTVEGMKTKLLEGGWSFRVPDGYINTEERAEPGDRQNARYRRWVEQDPQQAKVWRDAWDLLLSDQYSLAEICEQLHARGYTRGSGKPFVTITKAGRRNPQVNALSRIFHNWFYAGWVVVENDWMKTAPKELRGQWEPIVSTEEFERGLAILVRRNQHRNQQKQNFYLLQGLIYLQEKNGTETRLICSTSNTNRRWGGTAYYCIRSSNMNFKCKDVDARLEQLIYAIQIDKQFVPMLQQTYMEELEHYLRRAKLNNRGHLEARLQELKEYEKAIARKNARGILSDDSYQELWQEFNEQYNHVRATLDDMQERKPFISKIWMTH
ncbi:MAG: recombinase family protein [Anaerolineae bacterium]|nr:recombinase family protein [Anaerolineae bacterium]